MFKQKSLRLKGNGFHLEDDRQSVVNVIWKFSDFVLVFIPDCPDNRTLTHDGGKENSRELLIKFEIPSREMKKVLILQSGKLLKEE